MSELVFRLAILLAIFGSVFVVSQLVLGSAWRRRAQFAAVNMRMRMLREGVRRDEIMARLRKNAVDDFARVPEPFAGVLRAFQRTLFASGVPFSMSQVLAAMGLFCLVVFVVLWTGSRAAGFYTGPGVLLLLIVLSASIAIILPIMAANIIAQRRRKRIQEQFPVALDVFVRALRSGHPIASAIDLLTRELEDPIGSEFGLVADEISYGAELTEALDAMAERWDQEDIRMFVVSLSVQIETGGNLAEILQNLSDVIRARASLYMKVRALSSEGRMTGWMLSVLPVFAFVSMFIVNPGFYLDVARDSIFVFGFSGLMVLYVIGVITIRKMIDLKV